MYNHPNQYHYRNQQQSQMMGNGAGSSAHPAAPDPQASTPSEPATANTIYTTTTNDSLDEHRARLASLLQQTSRAGPQQSAIVTAAVAPHLPAILSLAKAGQLDATQMAQLKTLVRLVAENNKRNQAQRPAQDFPQVQAGATSLPNSSATMSGTPPQQTNNFYSHSNFLDQHDGVRATGTADGQPQQPQASQPTVPPMPKFDMNLVLQRARQMAATQGRTDEQYVMALARTMIGRAQQAHAARAAQTLQAAQSNGVPGAGQTQMPTQAQTPAQAPQAAETLTSVIEDSLRDLDLAGQN